MLYIDYVAAAPCRGVDPKIFDAVTPETALAGLDICRTCNLWKECEEFIDPYESCYDGIAAGAVWKDGRIVAMLRARANQIEAEDK